MKSIHFYKYHGSGNDFVLLDDPQGELAQTLKNKHIAFLCHRHFGIGADGLMLLHTHPQHDFEMRYFNADGNESTMCGNGGRCIVAFAQKKGYFQGKNTRFLASDGTHQAEIFAEQPTRISLQMKDVAEIENFPDGMFLDTGSPHFVRFVPDLHNVDIFSEGKKLRYSERFGTGGTNVNFVQIDDNTIKIATYERGVENETLACGTGAVAAAIATSLKQKSAKKCYEIQAKGGKLEVCFEKNDAVFTEIKLKGTATLVFEGKIDLATTAHNPETYSKKTPAHWFRPNY